jgi:predicted phage terminase large subunit-like protein
MGQEISRIEIKVKLPEPHALQAQILSSPKRFKVVACGRRFGKTRLGALAAMREILGGGACMWVAPSHQKAEIAWRITERLAAQIPGLEIRRGDARIISPNGGWAQFFSADAAGGLRGEGLTLAIIDEAAHIRDLGDIWTQEIRPSLSDRKGGAIFISSPFGFNYFYELFLKGQGGDDEWQSWQFPSWDSPYIDLEEIERARRDMPDLVFRQEYGAEFVSLEGALFRREYFKIVERAPELSVITRHWDLAASTRSMADYSVGAKIGMDADGNIYILDVVRGRWEWPALLRIIRDTALMDGNDCAQSVEVAGTQKGALDLLLAEPALADIPFRGIPVNTDKIMRANPLLARAEQGKVHVVRGEWNQDFLNEICAFPTGEHDDQVDAVSGALSAIATQELVIVGF